MWHVVSKSRETELMASPKKLIILGTGGNCVDILDAVNERNVHSKIPQYECIGFLDDDQQQWGKEIWGVQVLGPLESAATYLDAYFVNGIGSERNFWKKAAIIAKTRVPLDRFETIVHPTASISRMAMLGKGVVVLQHVTIANQASVGNHVIILPNSVISHDVVIGDYSCITGGVCISGLVTIGRDCYLGTNSSIISGVKIGNGCLIGMGAVIRHDVPEHAVMVGNPARLLRKMQE
jgi:sugar O-acyltransferase (sialic acid O-acetyltransferase NeuD family)